MLETVDSEDTGAHSAAANKRRAIRTGANFQFELPLQVSIILELFNLKFNLSFKFFFSQLCVFLGILARTRTQHSTCPRFRKRCFPVQSARSLACPLFPHFFLQSPPRSPPVCAFR
jgi:hypothetical protein